MENKNLNEIMRSILFDEENCTTEEGLLDAEFLMDRFGLTETEVVELMDVMEGLD